jgi:ribosomal protein S12 methylthiotransferase accessory factor
VLFGRVAARSEAFAPIGNIEGNAPVLVGAAAGEVAADVSRRARGELIERVSNVLAGRNAEASRSRVATYEQLRRMGAPALDPASWAEHRGHVRLREASQMWVMGRRSLTTDREVLIPAGAVFLRHRPPPGSVATTRAGSTGIAAHPFAAAAIEHAVLEVLERDLIWRSWYTDDGATGVLDLPAHASHTLGLGTTYLTLGGPVGSACVVACLWTGNYRQQSFGARCGWDERAAAVAATYEALMVRWSMGTPEAERAWRAMPSSRPRNALEHALVTFHAQDSLGQWLRKAAGCPALARPPGDTAALFEAVAAHTGEDVVAVDTTAPEVCSDEDITVVRVVAPGAHRLPADETDGDVGTPPHPIG